MAPLGGGGLFSRFLGVGAVVGAFTSAITRAQELRDEATRLGQPLDAAVERVAKLGDSFSAVKDGARDLGVSILGIATDIGETIGQQIVRLKGLANGKSFAETDKAVADSEAAGSNADRLARENANPAAAANAKKRDDLREAARRRELNDFNLLNQLQKDRDNLQAESVDKSKTLAERTAAQVAFEQKQAEIKALGAKIEKEVAADRTRSEKEAAAALEAYAEDWAGFFSNLDAMSKENIEKYNADQKAAADQRARLEESRRTRYMTDEQKLWDVVKQGRAAQAELNANPKDENAKLKVEELRQKYLDLKDAITGANNARDGKGPVDPDAADRGEDGKIYNNGAVVSQEDRNRSRATRTRDAGFNQQTRSQQIQSQATRDAAKPGGELKTALSTTETYLQNIETALTTSGTT